MHTLPVPPDHSGCHCESSGLYQTAKTNAYLAWLATQAQDAEATNQGSSILGDDLETTCHLPQFLEPWNDLWHYSEMIASKLCSKIWCKWKAMFKSHVETCIDWANFDFWFKDILRNLLLKIIMHSITDQPSMTWSCRPVLNFKFSVLLSSLFQVHELLNEHSSWAKLCEGKCFNSNLYPYSKMYRLKELWYILSGLDIQLQ